MLKACCDCLAPANIRESNDVAYGSVNAHVNGSAHTQLAPPWPQPRYSNEKMYLLPKPLAAGDRVEVTGRMRNEPQMVTVNLVTGSGVPDYGNVACQVEARFSEDNRMSIKIIHNGYTEEINGDYQDIPASDWFAGSEFNFGFIIRVGSDYGDGHSAHSIEIQIGNSHLDQVRLKHNINDIRFLTLHGDIERVDKLDFVFG